MLFAVSVILGSASKLKESISLCCCSWFKIVISYLCNAFFFIKCSYGCLSYFIFTLIVSRDVTNNIVMSNTSVIHSHLHKSRQKTQTQVFADSFSIFSYFCALEHNPVVLQGLPPCFCSGSCCCCCWVASIVSDSVRPHRRQTTRLPRLWDSPGKNTEVGCHFLLQCMKVKSESEVAQSCPTLCNTMDCSLPGSSIHEIALHNNNYIKGEKKEFDHMVINQT